MLILMFNAVLRLSSTFLRLISNFPLQNDETMSALFWMVKRRTAMNYIFGNTRNAPGCNSASLPLPVRRRVRSLLTVISWGFIIQMAWTKEWRLSKYKSARNSKRSPSIIHRLWMSCCYSSRFAGIFGNQRSASG